MNDITIGPSDFSTLTNTDYSTDFTYKDKTRTRAILVVLAVATTIGGGAYWFLTHGTAPRAVPENIVTSAQGNEPAAVATTAATAQAEATSTVAKQSVPFPVGIRRVHFAFNQARLTPATKAELDDWAKAMVTSDSAILQIDGHADERGTRVYNQRLGLRRANAVKGYLIAHGVPAEQLRTFSYGEMKPLAKGRNQTSWAKNRRVELHLIADTSTN